MPKRLIKIALDMTPLMPTETGVDRFMLNLVAGLAAVDRVNEYLVFINQGDESRLPQLDPSRWELSPVRARSRPSRLLFQQFELPRRLRREGADILYSLSFLAPLRAPGLTQVLSVHDMTFFTRPEVHNRLRRSALFLWLVARSIDRADHLLVPSHAVREEVLRLHPKRCPETVHVSEYGLDPRFRPVPPEAVEAARRRLGLPPHYILFVGTLEPRKNLERLMQAYAELVREGFEGHLVLAGQWGWKTDGLRRQIRDPKLAGRIHLTGYLPNDDLVHVYAGAEMLVQPSMEEGFGFAPLEAMGMGVPVIVSDSPALTELYGEAALTVDPDDASAIASAIRRLAVGPALRSGLRSRGLEWAKRFSWESAAARTLGVIQTAIGDAPADARSK